MYNSVVISTSCREIKIYLLNRFTCHIKLLTLYCLGFSKCFLKLRENSFIFFRETIYLIVTPDDTKTQGPVV